MLKHLLEEFKSLAIEVANRLDNIFKLQNDKILEIFFCIAVQFKIGWKLEVLYSNSISIFYLFLFI